VNENSVNEGEWVDNLNVIESNRGSDSEDFNAQIEEAAKCWEFSVSHFWRSRIGLNAFSHFSHCYPKSI
jgi:hypothetical protein